MLFLKVAVEKVRPVGYHLPVARSGRLLQFGSAVCETSRRHSVGAHHQHIESPPILSVGTQLLERCGGNRCFYERTPRHRERLDGAPLGQESVLEVWRGCSRALDWLA